MFISRSFDDICGKLEKQYGTTGCPVVAGTEGIQCMCPFQPGTVTIKDFEYTITDADLPGGITGLFLDVSNGMALMSIVSLNEAITQILQKSKLLLPTQLW